MHSTQISHILPQDYPAPAPITSCPRPGLMASSWPLRLPSPEDVVHRSWNAVKTTFLWGENLPHPPAHYHGGAGGGSSRTNNNEVLVLEAASKKRKGGGDQNNPDRGDDDASRSLILERLEKVECSLADAKKGVLDLVSKMTQQLGALDRQQKDLHDSLKTLLKEKLVEGLERLGNGLADPILKGFEALERDIEELKTARFSGAEESPLAECSEKTKELFSSLTSPRNTKVPEISAGLSSVLQQVVEERQQHEDVGETKAGGEEDDNSEEDDEESSPSRPPSSAKLPVPPTRRVAAIPPPQTSAPSSSSSHQKKTRLR